MDKKVRLQPLVSKEVADKLGIEAANNGHKISPYAAHILTKHISKQEVKPNVKKEYGKPDVGSEVDEQIGF